MIEARKPNGQRDALAVFVDDLVHVDLVHVDQVGMPCLRVTRIH